MFILTDVTCGSMEFDTIIPNLTSSLVTVIQVGIPVILIFLGMIDLGRAVMSNDEKEMKSAQGKLIKRVIYAVLIFLVVAIVKLVFGLLSDATADKDGNNKTDFSECIDCFVNGVEYDAKAKKMVCK